MAHACCLMKQMQMCAEKQQQQQETMHCSALHEAGMLGGSTVAYAACAYGLHRSQTQSPYVCSGCSAAAVTSE
jgi:hypothetical protein